MLRSTIESACFKRDPFKERSALLCRWLKDDILYLSEWKSNSFKIDQEDKLSISFWVLSIEESENNLSHCNKENIQNVVLSV